jgi:Type-F conjugative transfer system pilin assembly protein
MPICKPSANSVAAAVLVPAIAVIMAPNLPAAAAQQAAANRQAGSAREAVQSQGDAAMERLKGAVAKRKEDGASAPAALPELPEAERRRAFEAMRRHAPSPVMEARARAALDAGKDAFAGQRDAMAKRLRQALGLEAPEIAAVAKAAAPDALHSWVPVLFVSSSMPIAELRTYARQLENAGGVMAFRGMPGGLTRVGPMARLSAEILRLDPGCEGPACAMRGVQLIVDPLVFRQHGVNRVPALGLIPGDPTQPYCERDETSLQASHIIYGDAALTGMLDEYARLGGKEEVRDAQSRLENR